MKNEKIKRFFADGYLFIVLALLYLPILLIIVYSFSGTSNFRFPHGFTLDSYKSLFSSDSAALMDAIKNTLILALSASAISTVLGDTGRGEPYALSIVRELLSVMTIVMAFSSRLLSR